MLQASFTDATPNRVAVWTLCHSRKVPAPYSCRRGTVQSPTSGSPSLAGLQGIAQPGELGSQHTACKPVPLQDKFRAWATVLCQVRQLRAPKEPMHTSSSASHPFSSEANCSCRAAAMCVLSKL